jgi:ketosteroid isomerase-like protein
MNMIRHQPIDTPITGREDLGGSHEPLAALAQFYRAFNTHDLALMAENWLASEDVAMDNPLGGIMRGWQNIRVLYERVFSGPARVQVEFYDYTLHTAGDVFYAVGRERGSFERNGNKLDLAIRTSRIFKHVGNRWRQVHHHGSIDDPALLKAYQQAVR